MIKKIHYGILCTFILLYAGNIWIETTQEDFADGTFEQNIYASHYGNGVVEFAPRFDLNNDGYLELYVSDRYGPYARLYWGSNSGYNSNNVTLFPSTGGANFDAADLNNDGYPDLLINHYFNKISIYWGTPSGPNPNLHFDIPMGAYNRQGVFIADFNKDGYLDISTTQEQIGGNGAIFWGDATGFNINNRTDLPMIFGVHNMEVADFNLDSWLDIAFVEYYGASAGQTKIYWGSNTGFSPSNCLSLSAPIGNHGLSTADLNGDQYLDLVMTGWYGVQSYIYWGSEAGFSGTDMQVLNPGYCYGGSSIADLDNDGYLDIVYHRGGYGSTQQRIYWGSATGYSNANSQGFGYALEATGGLIADLNGDGHLDIFTNTRTPTTQSYIFWGPDFNTSTSLPSVQDHHGHFRQIGNVYNREYYEDYVSSVFDAGATTEWYMIEWDAYQPSGTAVLVWVRTGNTPMPDQSWSEWQSVSNGGSIPANLNARYIQYQTRLCFANPCFLPMLEQMTIGYGSTAPILADVRIEPEVINLQSHGKFIAFITLNNASAIDISTVVCEGAPAVSGNALPTRPKYIARFNVDDLIGVTPGPAVLFTVTGQLFDGTNFVGYDTVCVIGHDNAVINITPNPFREKTVITMTCPGSSDISVRIYSVNGALVRDFNTASENSGVATITWNKKDNSGRTMPAGVYLFKIQSENTTVTKKVIILK